MVATNARAPGTETAAQSAFEDACTAIVATGKAEPSAVIRVRTALLCAPETGGVVVNAAQAGLISVTNEAIAFARNASAWRTLYAGSLASFLASRAIGKAGVPELALARWLDLASSADAVPVPEDPGAAWLIRQAGRSENVSPAEQTLVELLKRHAPGLISPIASGRD